MPGLAHGEVNVPSLHGIGVGNGIFNRLDVFKRQVVSLVVVGDRGVGDGAVGGDLAGAFWGVGADDAHHGGNGGNVVEQRVDGPLDRIRSDGAGGHLEGDGVYVTAAGGEAFVKQVVRGLAVRPWQRVGVADVLACTSHDDLEGHHEGHPAEHYGEGAANGEVCESFHEDPLVT